MGAQTYSTSAIKSFLDELQSSDRPVILDIGCLCASNIELFTKVGCKVFVDDLLKLNIQAARRSQQTQELHIDTWLATFDYPDQFFDAILCWDTFDYLDAEQANVLCGKLWRALKGTGRLLVFFRPENSTQRETAMRYRIANLKEIVYEPLPVKVPRNRGYQNRDILALLGRFSFSNSFILTNGWREIVLSKK
jgi:SAM-dependent methyltransferase